jgi:hypothetical protein
MAGWMLERSRERLRSAKENDLFASVCPGLVRDAVGILEEMMNE